MSKAMFNSQKLFKKITKGKKNDLKSFSHDHSPITFREDPLHCRKVKIPILGHSRPVPWSPSLPSHAVFLISLVISRKITIYISYLDEY